MPNDLDYYRCRSASGNPQTVIFRLR